MFYVSTWDNYSSVYGKSEGEYVKGRLFMGGAPRNVVPLLMQPAPTLNRREDEGYGAVRAIDVKTGERKWEFKMVDVTDAFSSPSSLMPQKKNALVLEYVRSRAARMIGGLAGCHVVTQNVGFMDTEEVEIEAYLPLYDAFAAADEALPTIAALVPVMRANRELMRARAAWGFSSVTALAEAIQTQHGLSYRTAHRVVARAVLLAVEKGADATGIDTALLDEAAREMIGRPIVMSDDAIARCLDPRRFVEQHKALAGTAPAEVRRMAASRAAILTSSEAVVEEKLRRIGRADEELVPLTAFVLPGGTLKAALLHLARTVCRRAERGVVALAADYEVPSTILEYLNRLSDLLFTLARLANQRAGKREPGREGERRESEIHATPIGRRGAWLEACCALRSVPRLPPQTRRQAVSSPLTRPTGLACGRRPALPWSETAPRGAEYTSSL